MEKEINIEKRKKTCCFTGHRPEKLNISEQELEQRLRSEIRKAIKDGYVCFISGMARGADLIAARIIIDEKTENSDIQLVCASPYKGFENRWDEREKEEYRIIMEQADETNYICGRCFYGCYQIRNEWMVDKSSRVIAVYSGEKGGTKNTIDYAVRNGIPIYNVIDVQE